MTNKLRDIIGRPLPRYADPSERHGNWLGAVQNAYMLDTSIGQAVMFSATAKAFGVALSPVDRRIEEGYDPFQIPGHLDGFESFLDEFTHSRSPEETEVIKQMIENNLDLRTQLQDWGGTRLFAGLLDPVNLIPVPFALGKGFATGVKRALSAGVPIVGITEGIRHSIDPTSTTEETLFATVGGSLFMGVIGGAVGLIPKDTIRLSTALNRLIPPQGTTSMFAGVPYHAGGSPKNLFARVTAALKSAASYGDPAWTKVDPETITVHIDDSFPDRKLITIRHKDGGDIVTAWHVGDELQIGVEVPKELQRQGIGSFAIREALKYAEDNALVVTPFQRMTNDAVQLFKAFADDGFNVKENPNFKVDADGTRVATDGKPLFVVRQIIDPDAKLIPKEARVAIDDLNAQAKRANAEVKILEEAVKILTDKWRKAPVAGGSKTKSRNALDKLLAQTAERKRDALIANRNAQDINIRAAQLLSQETIKDWDLLPTGYNTLLGKLDQFPWWKLLKTKFRDLHPDLAVKYQMFALRMASTPGLNNRGNKLGHTTGPSVESLAIEYTGRWLGATREAQAIYRVYTGHGASSGQVKHFFIDQQQRVRGTLNRWEGKGSTTETPEGKLTIQEFDRQITMAIANGGKHEVPEVAKAAALYIPIIKSIGDDGKKLGIFATQINIQRRIDKVVQQLDEFNEKYIVGKKYTENTLPPGLRDMRNKLELEKLDLDDMAIGYIDADNPEFIHRMWIAEEVIANEAKLKEILTREFTLNPKKVFRDKDGNVIPEHPDIIRARVNETYASILHEADTGNNGAYAPNNGNSRRWLEGRKAAIEDGSFRDVHGALSAKTAKKQIEIIDEKLRRIEEGGTIHGATGPLIARRLDLDDTELLELNLIESDITTWMQHYVARTAPMIETARVFGDARAQKHIDELYEEAVELSRLEKDPDRAAAILKEADKNRTAMNDLRDIVHGVYQIPDNPDAITPRILRMLRNFNILGAMGRSVLMALGDTGNIVMSQGLRRSLGYAVENFASGLTDGNIKMIRNEVDLAGSVSEVILGMRYHQMTDFGIAVGSSKYPGLAKFERGLAAASQRFFLYNLLGPWTDMARRFSGGMVQSRIIENSLLWRSGNLVDDEITIMNRLGISKEQAIQFADEWEASGKLKHGKMFIANTSEWISEQGTRTFRAAINTEIGRMVPTPGAVDKPKALLKGEWWKVIGQYRGFSIAATHRIMGAGIHQKGMQKYAGFASMVGIAMMVDAFKRPDYIQLTLDEQILRAVELSAVTGILLDVNDMIERMSAGGFGIRPALGMDIRERSPNWANRMGTIGAVPNQWLTLMYGLTSDNAEADDTARAIRYMIPYNNLIWWNSAFTRMQRASVDLVEDTRP